MSEPAMLPVSNCFVRLLLLVILTSHAAVAQVSHDAFSERRVLEGAPLLFNDTNRGARLETDEPNHSGHPAEKVTASIWYTWRAPESGLVLVDLAGSGFDTALGLYEGKNVDTLRVLGQNDEAAAGTRTSRLLVPVQSGADYQIAVASARGAAGDVRFQLRMVTKPEIVSGPDDLTATYGETVVIRTRAMGVPPLRYQWYSNGVPISGRNGESSEQETELALSLSDITDAVEGAYWVEVTNDRGAVSSRRARLSVGLAPKIVEHPVSIAAGDGQDVAWSVRALGRPPLTYRWQRDGVDLPGSGSPDYALRGVLPAQAGTYRAIVTNPWGTATSDGAILTVSGSIPVFRLHPRGVTNLVGSAFELSVAVDGSRPMTLQWSKDGVPVAGKTASNLVVTAASVGDSGVYSVRAANARGAAESQIARVRILPPPPNDDFANALAIVRTNYPVLETGYNVGATREAGEPGHDGPPAAQSVWWTWRAPARGMASVEFTNTTFEPRLGLYTGTALAALRDVPYRTPLVDGTLFWLTDPETDYSLAIDRAGTATGDLGFRLNFTTNLAGPLILRPPVAKTVPTCGELLLEVIATNQPTRLRYPLSYQWRFGGIDIPGATTSTLRIPRAETHHAGLYSVRVTNYGGSTTTAPIRCEVVSGPQFTIEPSDLDLPLCANSRLQALAFGCEPISYQWRFDGVPIPGATNDSLALDNVEVTDAGKYSVVAENADGATVSRVARVRVDPSPRLLSDTLGNFTVRECAEHTFRVEADASCRPLTYQWFFNRTQPIPGATTPRLTLSNIQTNNQGDYWVVVDNQYTATTSRVGRLTVSALPIIPGNQPEDRRRVRLGDSFAIQVDPQSCTPMSYRWFYNGGTSLPGLDRMISMTNVTATATNVSQVPMLSGQTGPRLVFNRPSTNLSGTYRVEVRNTAGVAVSRDAVIEILEPPPNDHFQNRIVIPGTNTVVSGHDIIATRETGEPTHVDGQRWNRSIWWTWTAPEDDGYLTVDLAGSKYDTLLALYSGDSLSNLRRLASDDNGGGAGTSRVADLAILAGSRIEIAVDGKNDAEGQTRVLLIFNADTNPPAFKRQPQSVAVLPGGTASFTAEVERTPRIRYQWQFDGRDLPGETNSTLTVRDVQRAREGGYVLLAWNRYGTTPSHVAWLTTGGIVRGQVTDATNKRPIPNARVSVGEGPAEVFALTDANGNYELVGARPGTLRADFDADRRVVGLLDDVVFLNQSTLDAALLACAATHYYRFEDRHYVVTPGGIVTNSFSLSPELRDGLRFVLNWGLNPADLDLHVRTPRIGGQGYEIDYRNRYTQVGDNPPYGQLDADEQHSFGPETVTLHRFADGRYQVLVQKFDPSARGELATSKATVRVYDNSGLLRVIEVPASGAGRFWHVLDVDGRSHEIAIVNRIVDSLPAQALAGTVDSPDEGTTRNPVERPTRRKVAALQATSRARFGWDFGDGTKSESTADRVSHRYPRPGVFDVSLAMGALVNGSNTNTTTARARFITVTNDPPRVRITAPAARTILRLGNPLRVAANASDSDGTVSEVSWFANGRRIGTDAVEPFEIEWAPLEEQVVTLTAEAIDNHGARGWSEPVQVSPRDLWGDVLIVRNAPDSEIETMKTACEEIRCIGGQPLTVRILDRHELTFDLMKTFRLIVWNHLASTNSPLTAPEIELFRQCVAFGIPHYFIGEDLASMGTRLEPEARTAWTTLSRLAPAKGKAGPAVLENAVPGGHHDILFSSHAEFASFRYGGDLDITTADGAIDVVLAAAGVPVMVAYPSGETDTRRTRTVTQNFRVLDPTTGPFEENQRLQVFRSTVSWLIQCPLCPELDLQVHSLAVLGEPPEAGKPFTLGIELRHSGACDPTGVRVVTTLPKGATVIETEPSEAVRDGDTLIFRLGRMPNGFRTNLAVKVMVAAGGDARIRVCADGNNPDSYPGDDCRELRLELSEARVAPRLTVQRQDAVVRVDVPGVTIENHVLEESFDLRSWRPAVNTPQPSADGVFYLESTASPGRFYRARRR